MKQTAYRAELGFSIKFTLEILEILSLRLFPRVFFFQQINWAWSELTFYQIGTVNLSI